MDCGGVVWADIATFIAVGVHFFSCFRRLRCFFWICPRLRAPTQGSSLSGYNQNICFGFCWPKISHIVLWFITFSLIDSWVSRLFSSLFNPWKSLLLLPWPRTWQISSLDFGQQGPLEHEAVHISLVFHGDTLYIINSRIRFLFPSSMLICWILSPSSPIKKTLPLPSSTCLGIMTF